MKIFFILLLLSSALNSKWIYENEKGELYSYLNDKKIEFKEDGLIINNNFIKFNNDNISLLKNNSNFQLNLYYNDIIKTNITCYNQIEYNKFKVKIEDDKINIYSNDEIIFINHGKRIKSDILKSEYSIYFNEQQDEILNELNLDYVTIIDENTKSAVTSITSDSLGNIYITGRTNGGINDLLIGDNIYNHSGGEDVFVYKFNPKNELIWATYLGSNGNEIAFDILTDNNKIYLAGSSNGPLFPGTNDIKKRFVGSNYDGFISIFNIDGVLQKTIFNGSVGYDAFTNLDIDSNGKLWVIGRAFSNLYWTSENALYSEHQGIYDMVFMGIENNEVFYSSYLGTTKDELGDAMCVLGSEYVILSGKKNSYGDIHTSGNGYLYVYDIKNNSIYKSFNIGNENNSYTTIQNVSAASDNTFYISGYTNDNTLAKTGAYQENLNKLSLYIAKVDIDGNILNCTYVGGSENEGEKIGHFIKGGLVFNSPAYPNKVVFSGFTQSNDFPTTNNAFQQYKSNSYDAFLGIIDSELKNLEYSSFLGGTSNDRAIDIDFANKSIYIVGISESSDFPTTEDALVKEVKHSNNFGFLARISIPKEETPCNNYQFNITDFSKVKDDFNLVYDAVTYDSILRLTKSDFYQKGAIWSNNKYNVSNGFKTNFKFRMNEGNDYGQADGSIQGADGISFLIQNVSNESIGLSGGGIGFDGLKNCLAIELDLYENDDLSINDPNGNHIAIFASKVNISSNHNSSDLIAENANIPIINSDNSVYEISIEYLKEQNKLIIYLTIDNIEHKVLEVENFDLSQIIDLDNNKSSYLGIAASTGNAIQRHEILGWSFCGESNILDISDLSYTNNLYPNPAEATKKITLDFNEDLPKRVEVYDLLGNMLIQLNEIYQNEIELDISNLQSGTYIVKSIYAEQFVSRKFIVR